MRVRIFIINSGNGPTYPSPHIRMERSQTAGGRFTKKEWILISTRDHHRSPLRSVTGDPLEVSQTPEMGGSVGHLRNKWTSISTRDHHRSPLQGSIISLHRLLGPVDDYAGDGLEYNLSTCILAHLATPPPGVYASVTCPLPEVRATTEAP